MNEMQSWIIGSKPENEHEDVKAKFKEVLRMIDELELSAEPFGDQVRLDYKGWYTLHDFIVNHCGEDE